MKKHGIFKDDRNADPSFADSPQNYEPNAQFINLAIQGGGTHGAYAWGIIDRFIQEGRVRFEGICATSAGSMNAVVLAYGSMTGGPRGARAALHHFWKKISEMGAIYSPLRQTPFEFFNNRVNNKWNMDNSISYQMFDFITRIFSPYQFNPFGFNPLRQALEASVDFDELKKCQETKLFLSTTKVRTGKVKVFTTNEITADVVMASACLPHLFQAVKIGDDYFWDGGYMGNPALFPLFYHTKSRDVMILHINPLERKELPTTSAGIMNRLNEITFNSSLLKEMRAIAFVTKLIKEDWLKEEHKNKLKHILIHSIRADKELCDLSVASKINTDWHFLLYLRDLGRKAADEWLQENSNSLGKRSTVDLHAEFLDLGVEHMG